MSFFLFLTGKYVGQNSEDEFFLDRLSDIANDWRIHWVRTLEGVAVCKIQIIYLFKVFPILKIKIWCIQDFNESHSSDRIPAYLRLLNIVYGEREGDFALGAEVCYRFYLLKTCFSPWLLFHENPNASTSKLIILILSQFSYVDILIYQMIHDESKQSSLDVGITSAHYSFHCHNLSINLLSCHPQPYPNLKRLWDAVERRPNIAAYLASPRRHEAPQDVKA